MDSSQDLSALRTGIDRVDAELLALLNERAALSCRVGEIKRQSGAATLQPQRERQVLDGLLARNAALGGDLPGEHLERIWREIFSSSRELQRPLRVAFLGPEGTFSHKAALECLGQSVAALPVGSIPAVFRAVCDGLCEVGLVPLENSLQGGVGQSLDLFSEYRVHIMAEHYSRISHCLISAENDLAGVRRIYSHPQPLEQCAAWLRTHMPGIPLLPEESTAAAARRVLAESGAAAIGHIGLADSLGLGILAQNLEDSPGNRTRFALIASGEAAGAAEALADEKTSLLFTVRDEPGALAKVLALLAGGGINMSKLESRPMRGTTWQYVFFADLDCDVLRPEYADTLAALRTACQSMKILGIYQRGAAKEG